MESINSTPPKLTTTTTDDSTKKKVTPWDELTYAQQEPFLDKARWLIGKEYLFGELDDVASQMYRKSSATK